MTRIEIDHLEIRLRNISQESIGSIVDGLGPRILEHVDRSITESGVPSIMEGPLMIRRIDAGVIREGTGSYPHDLQGAVAESVVRTITGSMAGTGSDSASGIRGGTMPQTGWNGIPERKVNRQ